MPAVPYEPKWLMEGKALRARLLGPQYLAAGGLGVGKRAQAFPWCWQGNCNLSSWKWPSWCCFRGAVFPLLQPKQPTLMLSPMSWLSCRTLQQCCTLLRACNPLPPTS